MATSVSSEYKLVESIVWSKNEFSLSDFVEKCELPQLVRVEIGFFGENERSTLSGGQLLTLHTLRRTAKVMCEASFGNVIVVPLSCPLKAEVQPLPRDCQHSTLTARQLAKSYSGSVKYLRVLSGHDDDDGSSKGHYEVGDILKVISIDNKNLGVRCTNVANNERVFVPFRSTASFSPLLDHKVYTLAEIKKEFGFPAKVRFFDTKMERRLQNKDSSTSISSLGELTVLEEFEESVVISTTICGSLKDKVCLQIPKDLEITVVVAEGYMSGDETYQKIVRTLDKEFHRTNLKDFQDLDVYQHIDAVKKGIQDMSMDISTGYAPDVMKNRLAQLRAKAFIDDTTPPPPLVPRISTKSQTLPPRPPPKPPPRPRNLPKPQHPCPKSSSETFANSPQPLVNKSWKTLSLPFSFKSMFNNQHNDKSNEIGDQTTTNDNDYAEPLEKAYSDPDKCVGYYTDLNSEYESIDKSEYQKFLLPTKPNIPLPVPPEDPAQKQGVSSHEDIYQEIARIPQDLSGLSVKEVGKALMNLNLGCYVEMFEEELIDGDILQGMDEESLQSLNLIAFHVNKLMRFIRGWRPKIVTK